ncbi:hypothetical protein Fmac_025740 [Flemingia macrophylla]|uniref:Methyltransferase-like protein 13 n=1 Tax=Flemingia macrophylla TaxID=520843 RepID=A0ABD1LT29_9FABA
MAIDPSTFESITPSRFICFTIPHPTCSDSLLRVAVLDSPIHPTDSPRVSAMVVPEGRETDWIFSTELGHLQLLFTLPQMSRLILIGNHFKEETLPARVYSRPSECSFHQQGLHVWSKPLLLALSPRSLFKNGVPEIPLLSYEDNLVSSVVLHACVGCHVGEMLVEDVEIENGVGHGREFRRRLRFKRMPNLIQTEICVVPERDGGGFDEVCIGDDVGFVPDLRVLVHPYLGPMVASLVLVSGYLEGRIRNGFRPTALCLGVGGGALLTFLRAELGFEVMGVDSDREVLRVARKYFGLEECEFVHVVVGDAFESMKKLACHGRLNGCEVNVFGCHLVEDEGKRRFDVVMIDLDTSDVRNGVSSPPLEFVRKDVLLVAKLVLCEYGILVVNVIPPSRFFYDSLVNRFKDVFHELYKIDVGNGENFVLIATVSPLVFSVDDCGNSFLMRLKSVIPESYINSITKI